MHIYIYTFYYIGRTHQRAPSVVRVKRNRIVHTHQYNNMPMYETYIYVE